MKIRTGFVSNSSSSSFVCDVSGEIASGWDMSLSDAEMYSCERGHIFCQNYAMCEINELSDETKIRLVAENNVSFSYDQERPRELRKKEYEENIKNFIDENDFYELIKRFDDDEDYSEEMQYSSEMPAEMCPICSFDVIRANDAVRYLYKKFNTSEEDVKAEIKEKFSSYDELVRYLTEKE